MIEIPFQIQRQPHRTTVLFGENLAEMCSFSGKVPNDARLIVDENVWHAHRQKLDSLPGLKPEKEHRFIVPSGETSKNLALFGQICEQLLATGLRRNTTLYVAGGGVTGDLGGFVAASLLRGLPLVQIPTTILAMVDSAFGGKTGINSASGKNLIGSFYQSESVLADVSFLESLPEDEWKNGLGEIVKYGLIADPKLLDMDWETTRNDRQKLSLLLAHCAGIKVGIVERDETETGERAFLNLGHTFAHALEAVTDYKAFKHGEAVFYGLLAALWVSQQRGAPVSPDRIAAFRSYFSFQFYDLKNRIPELIRKMGADKKNTAAGELRLVLLRDYAQPEVTAVADRELITSAWNYLLAQG